MQELMVGENGRDAAHTSDGAQRDAGEAVKWRRHKRYHHSRAAPKLHRSSCIYRLVFFSVFQMGKQVAACAHKIHHEFGCG